MKGLLRNNFYAVRSSIKATVLSSFAAIIIIAIVSFFRPLNDMIVTITVSGILGGFGGLSGTAIQKDVNCKWNKFELTMPVSRKDVVSARYLSFLIYILVGVVMAILSIVALWAVSDVINWERVLYGFFFGFAFALSVPTFLYPLVLLFGTDKNDALLFISIILGVGLFLGGSILVNPFIKNLEHGNMIFRIGYMVVSVGLFVLSYVFSLVYYRKKEL